MEIRKKVVRFTLISTILQGISLLLILGFIITLIVLIVGLTGVMKESTGLMENVNPDDVTAGWQVLFGAAGGVFGLIAGIVLLFAILFLIGPLIAETAVLIYGIRTYRKRDTVEFKRMAKNDSIIKLATNAVAVVLLVLSVFSSEENAQTIAGLFEELAKVVLFTLPSIACVVVSILALKNVNDIEELPEESEQQYIEYYEDKTPYFGQ